jgi:hypothetical protein
MPPGRPAVAESVADARASRASEQPACRTASEATRRQIHALDLANADWREAQLANTSCVRREIGGADSRAACELRVRGRRP